MPLSSTNFTPIETEQGESSFFGALYRQRAPLSAFIDFLGKPSSGQWDVNFDPVEQIKGTPYQEFADYFNEARNQDHFNILKSSLDKRLQDEAKLKEVTPWLSYPLQFAAGMVDPTVLIPVGTAIKGVKSAARAAGIGGGIAGASVGLGELARHEVDPLVTDEQSMISTAAAVGMGSLIGGLLKLRMSNQTKAVEDALLKETIKPYQELSVGAAQIPEDIFLANMKDAAKIAEMEKLAPSGGAAQLFGRITPALRLIQSDNPSVRNISLRLTDSTFTLRGNLQGHASPISIVSKIRTTEGDMAYGIMKAETEWKTYIKDTPRDIRLSREEFDDLVADRIRGWVPEGGVPQAVNKAAAALNDHTFTPLDAKAKGTEVFSPELKTRDHLFSIWNKDLVQRDANNFISKLADALTQKLTPARLAKFPGTVGEERWLGAVKYYKSIASELYNTIINNSAVGTELKGFISKVSGPFKGQELDIDYKAMRQYLINDPQYIARKYVRSVAPEVHLREEFGPKYRETIDTFINDDYDKLRETATTSKQLASLAKRQTNDLNDIHALLDHITGKYVSSAAPRTRALISAIKIWNTARLLGKVVLSSMMDPARSIRLFGISHVFGNFVKPFLSGVLRWDLSEFRGVTKELGILSGSAIERITSKRSLLMQGLLDDNLLASTRAQRVIAGTGAFVGKVIGINWWNDLNKEIATHLASSFILRMGIKSASGKISPRDLSILRELGVSDARLTKFMDNFNQFGTEKVSVLNPNISKWSPETREEFLNILGKAGDEIVLTPDFGGKPLFLNTPEGGMLAQFKTFSLASVQSTLIPLMQRPFDAATWQYVLATLALTAMSLKLKGLTGGYSPEGLGDFMVETLDKSGMFGIIPDMNSALEDATGYGARSVFGDEDWIRRRGGGWTPDPFARFISRQNPTFGLGNSIMKALGGASDTAQIRAIASLIPFNNHFLLLGGLRQIQDWYLENIGIQRKEP